MLHETTRQALIDASNIEAQKPMGTSKSRSAVINSIIEKTMMEQPEKFQPMALHDKFPEQFNKRGERIVSMSAVDVSKMVDNIWESL
jgi:hypothetical protein